MQAAVTVFRIIKSILLLPGKMCLNICLCSNVAVHEYPVVGCQPLIYLLLDTKRNWFIIYI